MNSVKKNKELYNIIYLTESGAAAVISKIKKSHQKMAVGPTDKERGMSF